MNSVLTPFFSDPFSSSQALPQSFLGKIVRGFHGHLRYVGNGQVVSAHEGKLTMTEIFPGQTELMTEVPDVIGAIAVDQANEVIYFGSGGKWDAKLNEMVNEVPVKFVAFNLRTRDQTVLCEIKKGRIESLVLSSDGSSVQVHG